MFWIDKTSARNPVVAPRGLEFAHLGVGSHGKTGRDDAFRIIKIRLNMGVSENSVPLNPMVNDHYPY